MKVLGTMVLTFQRLETPHQIGFTYVKAPKPTYIATMHVRGVLGDDQVTASANVQNL